MNQNDRYLMDSHKLLWHLDRVSAWQRGERIAPLHIDVGLSKGCNIRCQYCFGAMQGNLYKNGSSIYFPREPLLRYVREAGEAGVRSMGFIGEAEPLLNPHVYEAVVAGKRAGVDISLATNGILFDTGREGLAALEHLSWIRFNISAASSKAYERIHGSREFSAVVERIRFCTDMKSKYNFATTIGLQMVLTPSNVDQAVPLAQLGRDLGTDYLVIKQCSDSVDSILGVFSRLHEYDDFSDLLEEAEGLSTDDYKVIVKWKKIGDKGKRDYDQCLGVPFLLYSSGNGRLYPCGMFFDYKERDYRMGDLVDSSFKEILASERYWNIVEKMKHTDTRKCYSGCRTDAINTFIWNITNKKPLHVNFI